MDVKHGVQMGKIQATATAREKSRLDSPC